MNIPDSILTVFTAELEVENDTPTIDVPDRELDLGELDTGGSYRVAILDETATTTDSSTETTRDHQREQGPSSPPVEEGDHLEVEIEDVGEKGDGIARVGPGFIVFVGDTALGDRVTVEVTQVRENFAFAEVLEGEPISE